MNMSCSTEIIIIKHSFESSPLKKQGHEHNMTSVEY